MKAIIIAISLVSGSLAAGLGVANLDDYKAGASKRGTEPVMTFVHDQKVPLVIFLTMGSTFPALFFGFQELRSRKREGRDLVVRLLQLVHSHSFPDDGGGMDPKYRVSLFTARHVRCWKIWGKRPGWRFLRKKRVLACEHRTDGKMPKCYWELDGDHGIAVRAWRYKTTMTVAPPDGTPADSRRYLDESALTDEILAERSWRTAGMSAVPIPGPGTEPLAILLVEGDGIKVASNGLDWDAKTFAILLGEHR